jgi:hypothetical protein
LPEGAPILASAGAVLELGLSKERLSAPYVLFSKYRRVRAQAVADFSRAWCRCLAYFDV